MISHNDYTLTTIEKYLYHSLYIQKGRFICLNQNNWNVLAISVEDSENLLNHPQTIY